MPNLTDNEIYKSHWPDIISDYSDNIFEYRGKGFLHLENKRELECEFKIIQTRDGTILSLCNLIIDDFAPFLANELQILLLSGKTIEGYEIITEGPITRRDSHLSGSGECQIVFLISSVNIRIAEDDCLETISFGITNFEFESNCWIEEISTSGIIIPRRVKAIQLNFENDEILIRQVLDYEKVIKKLNAFETIDVTCEVSISISKNDDIKKKQIIVNDLCHLISVGRGTKINWIYYKVHNGKKLLSVSHHNNITKGFNSSNGVIIDRPDNCNIKNFLDCTYNTYIERKNQYQLDKETISAYLDAKAKGDYMEMRGAKLSIAMENLKAVYLDAHSSIGSKDDCGVIAEYIIEEESFSTYKKSIEKFLKSILEDEAIDKRKRGKIYKNISCMNRSSFEDILRELWKDIGLTLDDNSIHLFINSRNSLVHQCKFYCKVLKPAKKCTPLNNPVDEYFFLVSILDKTMLKILGYNGIYYNLQKREYDSI